HPAAGAQRFELPQELRTADEQRVVDHHQRTAARHQWPDLVHEPGGVLVQVDRAAARAGEERRVEDDGVEPFAPKLQTANEGEEVLRMEVALLDREAVQRVRRLRYLEEASVQVGVEHARRAAGTRGHAEASRVREGIQDAFAFAVVEEPAAQHTRVEVEAGVLVHQQVDGVAHAVLADGGVDLRVASCFASGTRTTAGDTPVDALIDAVAITTLFPEHPPPSRVVRRALALLDDRGADPRQPVANDREDRAELVVILEWRGVVEHHGRAPVYVDDVARVAFEVAVE